MNAAMGNVLPRAHQRDEEEVLCEMTKKREKKRERGEKREREIAQRRREERQKGEAE